MVAVCRATLRILSSDKDSRSVGMERRCLRGDLSWVLQEKQGKDMPQGEKCEGPRRHGAARETAGGFSVWEDV